MTRTFHEMDEDTGNSSNASSSTEESLIGSKIIEEEERLLIETKKIEMEENAKTANKEAWFSENFLLEEELSKDREAELKEKRYKRLMHLLNSSQTYSVLLRDTLQVEEATRKTNSDISNNSSKQEESPNGKKEETKFRIGDFSADVDNRTITDNVAKKTETVDYFKETRVNDLGFTVSSKQPILLEGGTMRDYQLEGLEWMKILFMNGVNGILGDEMGLGKTIQVISFICYLIEQDIKGPFLVVAPLSTISNWMNEFKRFAPKVPTMLYHGTEAERTKLFPQILQYTKVLNKRVQKVVITSFQIPLFDKAVLKKINWYYVIIDEGHRIKNHNSMLSRTLREFSTFGRLLLTGTPLQNDLSELWSLLNFLLPEVFNALDVFESWFDIKELETNGTGFMLEKFNINVVTALQEILMPFLLRRQKKDVNLQLPPKKEILIYCPLTPSQKKLYEATIDRSIELLLKPKEVFTISDEPLPKRRCFLNSPYGQKDKRSPGRSKRIPKISPSEMKDEERYSTSIVMQNPQMQLRKIVNHPYLIQFPLKPGTEELRIDEEMVTSSGKLLVLDAMLAKLKAKGHKVVVFSFFKILLDILEEHAIMRNYKYCRMDGQLKIADRDEELSRFNNDPEVFVFFISTRSGGLGINLTAADTVIFYDSDWNPQIDLQSQDRCHRIGQTKPVVVYRLCGIGTIDERIIERGNAKRRLEKMILQNGKYTLNTKTATKLNLMDLQELKKLLETTDHKTVTNSDGYVLTDKELEEVLDRSDMIDDKTVVSEEKENKGFKVLNYEKC